MSLTASPRTLTRPDDSTGADDRSRSGMRRIRRSAGLPSGRALLGALLVTGSVLGVATAYRSASAPPTTRYLVFARAVAAGSVISHDDLAFATAELVDDTAARAYTDPDDLVGKAVRVSSERGDLVLASTVTEPLDPSSVSGRRVSLSLDADQALDGDLAVGDRIDLYSLATNSSPAEVLVEGATVVSLGASTDGAIGRGASVSFTVAVPDSDAALRVVTAQSTSGITVVKAVELGEGDR